jgi:sirohydrochlorin ferrochelatase
VTDRDLVLLAHGSPDERHQEGVDGLGARVRALAPGRRVVTAYLDHHPPTPSEVAGDVDDAVVVPVLLTPAYHARVDVPTAVTAMRAVDGGGHATSAALGPHPLLLEASAELLDAAGVSPSVSTAVILYAAGSSDGRAVASVRETLAGSRPVGWGPWAVAALDGGRDLDDVHGVVARHADRVVVVPFVVAEGVLRDRMAIRCAELGVELAPGAFDRTAALARLVLARADDRPLV